MVALAVTCGATLLLTALFGVHSAGALVPNPPNILVILTDDQRAGTIDDLVDPASGQPVTWMPNVKTWFGNGGTEFPNAYATTPECCPSRSSIFTGQYAHNHEVKTIINDPGPPPTGASALDQGATIQHSLRDNGYRTGIYGKFLNDWDIWDEQSITAGPQPPDPIENPKHWDEWGIFNNGYGAYSGCAVPNVPANVPPRQVLDSHECMLHVNEGYLDAQGNEHGTQWNWYTYSTQYVRERALTFLQTRETAEGMGNDQPWFLYLAPYAPHMRAEPQSGYENNLNCPGPIPDCAYQSTQSASYYEPDRSDKPQYVRDGRCCARTTSNTETATATTRRRQLTALKSVDDMVGAVMQKLQDFGEANNTLAIFVSDNGFVWGEHALEGKLVPYTESINVPMYMRWPAGSVAAGASSPKMVANVDIAPTVLNAVGLPVSAGVDGKDLRTGSARGQLLLEYWREADVPSASPAPTWASIRSAPNATPKFQYIEYYGDSGNVTFREYYNLANDYGQEENLYGGNGQWDPGVDPTGAPDPAPLHSTLQTYRTCTGSACP